MVPRVLIIGPYLDLREAIALTLRREHYSCDAVAGVSDAADSIGWHDYALVVVDGASTGEAVASLDPAAHVVALAKPFGRSELLAAMR